MSNKLSWSFPRLSQACSYVKTHQRNVDSPESRLTACAKINLSAMRGIVELLPTPNASN